MHGRVAILTERAAVAVGCAGMVDRESRAKRREQQAREIEASQTELRKSIAETDRLVGESDKMLKRHRAECDADDSEEDGA